MRTSTPTIAPMRRSAGRDRLLKAARVLFLLGGLDAVTVDDICLAAGVSKGGFYHHFRNGEDVFLVIALEELRRDLELLVCATANTDTSGGADALLLDLWSWAPRRAGARTRVRSMYRKALRELAAPGNVALERKRTGSDREAQAMLALILGTGHVVRRALTSQAYAARREQKKAAAG